MKIGIDLKYITNSKKGGNIGDKMVQRNILRYIGEIDSHNEYHFYLNPDVNIQEYHAFSKKNVIVKKMPRYHKNSILRNSFSLPFELYKNPVDVFHGSASLPLFFKSCHRLYVIGVGKHVNRLYFQHAIAFFH